MQSNGVRRRKVVQYESVSTTANAYRRSDNLSLDAGSSSSQPEDSGAGYRYEYEYERSSFEIFSPASGSFAGHGTDILAQAIGEDIAQQFTWLAETDTIRTYENRLTRRYVHIDSQTGEFCDQQRNVISAQAALSYALPASQILTGRFAFAASSSPSDLQIGGFVRKAFSDARGENRHSFWTKPGGAEEDTQPTGIFTQLRNLLVTTFRFSEAFVEPEDVPSRQRAGLTLQEDYRPTPLRRDEFSLAAFTRRTA